MSLIARCTVIVSVSMLMGCASSPKPSAPPALPAALRQPCPELAPPVDGSAAAVLRTLTEWAGLYRECSDRHRAAVAAVK